VCFWHTHLFPYYDAKNLYHLRVYVYPFHHSCHSLDIDLNMSDGRSYSYSMLLSLRHTRDICRRARRVLFYHGIYRTNSLIIDLSLQERMCLCKRDCYNHSMERYLHSALSLPLPSHANTNYVSNVDETFVPIHRPSQLNGCVSLENLERQQNYVELMPIRHQRVYPLNHSSHASITCETIYMLHQHFVLKQAVSVLTFTYHVCARALQILQQIIMNRAIEILRASVLLMSAMLTSNSNVQQLNVNANSTISHIDISTSNSNAQQLNDNSTISFTPSHTKHTVSSSNNGMRMRIGLLNCRSLNGKAEAVKEIINEKKLLCLAQTETWLKGNEDDHIIKDATPNGFSYLRKDMWQTGWGSRAYLSVTSSCQRTPLTLCTKILRDPICRIVVT
jgi:hypothetical protein